MANLRPLQTMKRSDLINFILSKTKGTNYLEIGIRDGKNLAKIKAKNRVGVDPAYNLTKFVHIKNYLDINTFKLFKLTSDSFFETEVEKVFPNGIDLVFVDGLHNYDQSLRDVENSLKYLNPNGYIVMHDCNPTKEAEAFAIKSSFDEITQALSTVGIPGWTGEWNGDVWKTIAHLRASRPDLRVQTVDTDYGLGVITRASNQPLLDLDLSQLPDKDYHFLVQNRKSLLNLVSTEDFVKQF
jgi:hypothetical protein